MKLPGHTDLFNSSVSVGYFLKQPDCDRVARFLTRAKNDAYELGLVQPSSLERGKIFTTCIQTRKA